MKKKFTLHLDAILLLCVLFIASIGLNFFLTAQYQGLTKDNEKLQWQALADALLQFGVIEADVDAAKVFSTQFLGSDE